MVTTTRATSFVPGATGRVYYGTDINEHFQLWHGTALRQNMPLVVYCKPGHTSNEGERVMDPHTSSSPALGTAIDSLYEEFNWPIVSLEIRPPFSASTPKREPFTKRPWPGQILSVMKFMLYLREHYNDPALWTENGSIDRSKILFMGSSSGHTLGMLAACIPPEATPFGFGASLGARPFNGDHRPDAVAGFIGQVDWTQFALNPSVTFGPFAYDVMQYFTGLNGSLTNTSLEQAVKRSASPWWWLDYLEPERTKFWGSWGKRPESGPGADLTPDLWSPGTIQNVSGTAFFDPHHYFQARPWQRALEIRKVSSRSIWGTSEDNPSGPNTTILPTDSARAADLVNWVRRTLRWPVVS